jgi:hypothetical protein
MRRLFMSAAAVAAGAIAMCGMSTPAGAVEQVSASSLVITAYGGTSTADAMYEELTLQCDPAGGTHPDKDNVCAKLHEVDGNIDRLTPLPDTACLTIYQPVTVKVGGNWGRCVVHFERTYSNSCVARVESGGLFTF